MAVRNPEEAAGAIPVIDVGPALAHGGPALESVAGEVRRACEEVGFFYLAGHGVPPALVEATFAATREFHAMPLDEKLGVKINENNIGYLAVNQSMQRHSTVYSIAFFYSPNPASVIECLPTCVSADRPARYAPATYRDLVLESYNANYFHRKDHAASAAGGAREE
jgi:isopenicillin N synthase-like dioxygenase